MSLALLVACGEDDLHAKTRLDAGRLLLSTRRQAPPPSRRVQTSPFILVLTSLLAGGYMLPAAAAATVGVGRGLSVPVEHAPCVRLFHAHGDVGCRSPSREGVAGPLLLVDSERQLERIKGSVFAGFHTEAGGGEPRVAGAEFSSDGTTLEDGFIAVVPEILLNRATLEKLSSTRLLAGVLVLVEADEKSHLDRTASDAEGLYSPDVPTPQGDSTPTADFDVDASYRWNSQGDGLLMESLDFPVVLVTGDSTTAVRKWALANDDIGASIDNLHNVKDWRYPLYKARMTFYFGGYAVDLNSQACLGWTDIDGKRSPQCLPLGGQSSWASIGPPGLPERETVLAVAGMDSTSLFHDRAPGANSAVSGLVALLSAAESLAAAGRSGNVSFSDLPRQIVFVTFQAEAYGFTGSRRFVKDWRDGIDCRNRVQSSVSPEGREACLDPLYPSLEFLNLGRPAHVVSVDQVGCLPESRLWIHPSQGASAEDTGLISHAPPGGSDGGISVANATRGELPPTPLTAFVKANPKQSGFVISGYDEAFSCPYYHDHRDTKATVEASLVTAAAEVLARSTLLLAGGTKAEAETLSVNATLVETLIDCLLEDWSCGAVREYVVGELANMEETLGFRVSVDAPSPPSLYAGPLEFRNGGGLPTVRHTKSDGSWQRYPVWRDDFDPDHDKIQFVPNLLEIFCRAFLSEQASSAHAGGYGTVACQSSGDCPPEECLIRVSPTADSTADSATRGECVRNRCICRSGFHHIALDVGLEREETLNQYRVIDGALGRGAPLWTEVNWQGIGVEMYLDPGSAAAIASIGVGAAVTAFMGVGSWFVFRSLSKHKLL